MHFELGLAAGDYWNVLVGMYDNTPGNLRIGHQCDFQEIIGMGIEVTHAFLHAIDTTWNLGSKQWVSADAPRPPALPGTAFRAPSRYVMGRPPALG